MPDVEEIRLMLLQGRVPDHWRVIYGCPSLTVRSLLLCCVLPPLIGILFGFMLSCTISYFLDIPLNFNALYLNILEMIFYLAITILIISIYRFKEARNSVLVFLPEGCLQFSHMTSNLPIERQWKAIWYGATTDIQLHFSLWTGYLTIHTYDGLHYKWHPNPCFGSSRSILRNILIAYATYQAIQQKAYTSY